MAVGDRGGLVEPEDLLETNRQRRPSLAVVVHGQAGTRWDVDVGGRQAIKISAVPPVDQIGKGFARLDLLDIRAAFGVAERRSQPGVELLKQAVVVDGRPLVLVDRVEERETAAVTLVGPVPGEEREPFSLNTSEQCFDNRTSVRIA